MVQMLKKPQGEAIGVFKATLKVDVQFNVKNKLVVLFSGTDILVDVDNQIAYAEDYHFYIDPLEYRIKTR